MALVEFALLLPFLAMLVLGTVDLGRGFAQQNRLKNASREGAQYAQLKPARFDCTTGVPGIKQRVENEDPDLAAMTGFSVTVLVNGATLANHCSDPAPAVAGGLTIEVIVSAPFDVLTPFLGTMTGDPITQRASTKIVVQN